MSITKGLVSLNYGRRCYGLYLLVEETPPESGELFGVGTANESPPTLVVDVSRTAENVPAGEDSSHLQSRLARGGDQAHLGTQYAVDGCRDKRVVGTP